MKTEAFGGNFESYKKQFFAFNDDYPEIAGIIAPLIDEHTRLDEKLNQPSFPFTAFSWDLFVLLQLQELVSGSGRMPLFQIGSLNG